MKIEKFEDLQAWQQVRVLANLPKISSYEIRFEAQQVL